MQQLKRLILPGARTTNPGAVKNRQGAMPVEAAIVFPLFFCFVLVMFELARFFMIDNALGHAAQKGLALAKVIPQLEDDSPDATGVPKNKPLIAQVEELARKTAREVYGGQSGVEAVLVLPQGELALRDRLNKQPMELLASGDYRPLFGVIQPIRLTQKAVGFREPLFASSMPELVNCLGEKVTEKLAPLTPDQCKCQDQYAYGANCECRVPGWLGWASAPLAKGPSGKCGCDHIQGAEIKYGVCQCPACPSGEIARIIDNSCQCDTCSDAGLSDNGSGGCVCPSCVDPIAVSDRNNRCECSCPSWQVAYAIPLTDHIRYDKASKTCVCDATNADCPPGYYKFFVANHYSRMICDCRPCEGESVWNPDTKNCVCGLDVAACESDDDHVASMFGCSCTACTNGKKRINGACRCTPAAAQACAQQNSVINDSNCTCRACPPPSQAAADGTKCECPSDASCEAPRVLDKNSCYCGCPQQTTPCPANRFYDYSTCSCVCGIGAYETNFSGDCKGCANCPGAVCAVQDCKTSDCIMGANCQLVVSES